MSNGYDAGAFNALLERGIARPRVPQAQGLQEGVIVDVNTVDKTAIFTLANNPKFFYGPAPYGRTNAPVVGDKALIAFVGNGIDQPWILMTSAPA